MYESSVTPEEKGRAYEAFMRVWPDFARGFFDPDEDRALSIKETVRQADGSEVTLIGYSHFFRGMDMHHAIFDSLEERGLPTGRAVRFLDAPAGPGMTPHSLAAVALHRNFNGESGFEVDAFDISQTFTDIARAGVYPWATLWAENHKLYHLITQDIHSQRRLSFFRIRPDVASHVTVLDAQPFETFEPQKEYDVVIVNNLFMYLWPEQIHQSMKAVDQTKCTLFVCLHGDPSNSHERMAPYVPDGLVPVAEHPDWRNSAISRFVDSKEWYGAWARADGPA